MKRRTFLRGAAVVGSATLAKPLFSLSTGPLATQEAKGVQRTTPFGKNGIMIPDEGWRMWPDTSAQWEKDEIFLPDEVELQKLPTNPPSGGWDVLNDQLGTVLHCRPPLSSSTGDLPAFAHIATNISSRRPTTR